MEITLERLIGKRKPTHEEILDFAESHPADATFGMIKPLAVDEHGVEGAMSIVRKAVRREGFTIILWKAGEVGRDYVAEHYLVHKGNPESPEWLHEELQNRMGGRKVVRFIVVGHDALNVMREKHAQFTNAILMGILNPEAIRWHLTAKKVREEFAHSFADADKKFDWKVRQKPKEELEKEITAKMDEEIYKLAGIENGVHFSKPGETVNGKAANLHEIRAFLNDLGKK